MWNDQDAAALSKYIGTHPNFMDELTSRIPTIDTKSAETAAMSGARHAGAEDIVKSIKDMTGSQSVGHGTGFIKAEQD